ncbi:MAG: hypothetical protein ACK53L_02375, partial [Pirellulaceae bacterium]
MTVTPTGGVAASGTATIKDDGTGDIFNNNGTTNPTAQKNDDRSLSVSSPTVNEASPYTVFTVGLTSGQTVSLSLSNGTAIGGTTSPTDGSVDFTNNALQYSLDNGTTWSNYSSAFAATLTGGATNLLVRTPLVNDSVVDNGETFGLTVTPTGGVAASGTATIKDDGTGDIFNNNGTTNPTAQK